MIVQSIYVGSADYSVCCGDRLSRMLLGRRLLNFEQKIEEVKEEDKDVTATWKEILYYKGLCYNLSCYEKHRVEISQWKQRKFEWFMDRKRWDRLFTDVIETKNDLTSNLPTEIVNIILDYAKARTTKCAEIFQNDFKVTENGRLVL